MLLGLWLVLGTASPAMSVTKCCPQDFSLFHSEEQAECVGTNHTWYYMNFTFGIPDCNYTIDLALEGAEASCIDNRNGTETVIALNCPDEEDKFVVPNVNYMRKCCPIDRVYDAHLQTCWGEQEPSWPTAFFNILMYNAEGVVDLRIGVPSCPRNQVVVDHLVLSENVFRDPTASISFKSDGRKYVMNPDDVCLDRTERRGVLVVRTCEDDQIACTKHTCIRKCCPDGESFIEEITSACIPSNRSIRPMRVFNKLSDEKFVPLVTKNPAYWYGLTCPVGKYLDQETDQYFLDLNGSIYQPDGITTATGLFCIENIYNGNVTGFKDGDYVFLCFPEDENVSLAVPIWTTFGMMASSFFLFLTLVVYISLPSLQNLHGKTLICHVSCLLAAYSGLATVQLVTDQLLLQVCVIMDSDSDYCAACDGCLSRRNPYVHLTSGISLELVLHTIATNCFLLVEVVCYCLCCLFLGFRRLAAENQHP